MSHRIDPIQEGPETEAFWAMIAHCEVAIQALEVRDEEPPPAIAEALKGTYRLSYLCNHCEDIHRVNGSYTEVSTATQVLILQGARSVLVEPLAYALECDAQEADDALEEQGLNPNLNAKLHEQFFSGKKP